MGIKFQISLLGFQWNFGVESRLDKELSEEDMIKAAIAARAGNFEDVDVEGHEYGFALKGKNNG